MLALTLLIISASVGRLFSVTHCTTNNCNVLCSSKSIQLGGILTDGNNKQRIFKLTDEKYTYNFVFPVCGAVPAATRLYDFSFSSIWQNDRKSVAMSNYHLGLYDSDTWELNNNYKGGAALSADFQSGEYCDVISRNRTSTVYLLCNKEYSVTAPAITVAEVSTCHCKFNLK
jgi:hypothetical protein